MIDIQLSILLSFLVSAGISQKLKCGVVETGGLGRVVGGETTGETYPWYVAFTTGSDQNLSVACGGTLIAPRFVLTAAHCYAESPKSKWLRLYKLMYYLEDRCSPGNLVMKEPQPSKIEIHRRYRTAGLNYDIALVTLPTKAAPTPICLPSVGLKITSGDIIGFGSDLPRSIKRYPCKLQQATVPVLSRKECLKTGIGPTVKFLTGVICAGKTNGGVDTCDGDSGGPLQINVNGRFTIVGIVSFGQGCARENMPGVYTDVSYYLDWIRTRVQQVPAKPNSKPQVSFASFFNFTRPTSG